MPKPNKDRTTSTNDAKPTRAARLGKSLKSWVLSFALAIAVLMPIRSSIADWNDVPTGSMRPTILEGDRIWVNKLAYGFRFPFTTWWIARWGEPSRGEIVTCASPANGTRLVKRVIGVAGDRVAVSANRLIINGEPLDYRLVDDDVPIALPNGESVRGVIATEVLPDTNNAAHPAEHAVTVIPAASTNRDFAEVVVPEGHVLVMGDNRNQSLDSRTFGFVPEADVYGRSSFVAISFDRANYFMPRFDRWLMSINAR